MNATSSSVDLAAEGQGCHTLNVEAWDNMGLQSGDVTDGPLCYDSVAPTITKGPSLALQNHVGPVSSTIPVVVQWAGTDATSGIGHYTLKQSVDGGAFTQVFAAPGTSVVRDLAPGHTYQFKLTATDKANNNSVAKESPVYTLALLQENSSAIRYSTGWADKSVSGANGGTVDFASVAGQTATLSFTGIQAAWISTDGPNRGSASVKLGTQSAQTVDTHASSLMPAEIVQVVTGPSGAHKLVITVLGTAGHPRVDVDAFVVLAD